MVVPNSCLRSWLVWSFHEKKARNGLILFVRLLFDNYIFCGPYQAICSHLLLHCLYHALLLCFCSQVKNVTDSIVDQIRQYVSHLLIRCLFTLFVQFLILFWTSPYIFRTHRNLLTLAIALNLGNFMDNKTSAADPCR